MSGYLEIISDSTIIRVLNLENQDDLYFKNDWYQNTLKIKYVPNNEISCISKVRIGITFFRI